MTPELEWKLELEKIKQAREQWHTSSAREMKRDRLEYEKAVKQFAHWTWQKAIWCFAGGVGALGVVVALLQYLKPPIV